MTKEYTSWGSRTPLQATHYGVTFDLDKPITGVFNSNYIEWLPDETNNAIGLYWEEAIDEHLATCKRGKCHRGQHQDFYDHLEIDGERYAIGFKKAENGKYEPDPEAEYSALWNTNSNTLQVVASKWGIKADLCSPCYPGQADGDTPGVYLAFAPPPELFGDDNFRTDIRTRIFLLVK